MVDEAIRRAERLKELDLAWIESYQPTISTAICAWLRSTATPYLPQGESIYLIRHFREYMHMRRPLHRGGGCAHRRHHAAIG